MFADYYWKSFQSMHRNFLSVSVHSDKEFSRFFDWFCTIRYQPSSRENDNTDNTKMKKLNNDNYNTNSVYNGLFMA